MKRFWLFAGSYYYPEGGMSDLKKTFDSSDDLHDYYNKNREDKFWDWGQILDSTNFNWTRV